MASLQERLWALTEFDELEPVILEVVSGVSPYLTDIDPDIPSPQQELAMRNLRDTRVAKENDMELAEYRQSDLYDARRDSYRNLIVAVKTDLIEEDKDWKQLSDHIKEGGDLARRNFVYDAPSVDGEYELSLDIPKNLVRDYDLYGLSEIGIKINSFSNKATIDLDGQGSPVYPHGKDSYSGRFIMDIQAAHREDFDAAARNIREAQAGNTLTELLMKQLDDDEDYIKGTDVDGEAQRPSLYELHEMGVDRPSDVSEERWKAVQDQYYHDMVLENTPEEFFPGYDERMEIRSGDFDDSEHHGSMYFEVEIPANLARDYDLKSLDDLGIPINDGRATILADAQGSPIFPDGEDSYTGRFLTDLLAAEKPAFDAKAQEAQEAQKAEDTLLEIGAMGMVMRPQKAEDGSMEYMVDYRSDSPGFERGDAETPASANIVGSLPEALSTAKDMAAQRDKVLSSIAEAQVADTSVQKSYVVLSADEMKQAVATAKGEAGASMAKTIDGNEISISITDDGIVATNNGNTMRAVKENSGAHLAEVKAEFGDQDIMINKVATTGEYRVDFRKDTFGYQAGEDGSSSYQDSVTDAALDAKARVEWREAHRQEQVETKVDTEDDDKQRLRLVAS